LIRGRGAARGEGRSDQRARAKHEHAREAPVASAMTDCHRPISLAAFLSPQQWQPVSADIRRIPGGFVSRIAPLVGLRNSKSPAPRAKGDRSQWLTAAKR
jgi:hypothetical protein